VIERKEPQVPEDIDPALGYRIVVIARVCGISPRRIKQLADRLKLFCVKHNGVLYYSGADVLRLIAYQRRPAAQLQRMHQLKTFVAAVQKSTADEKARK